MTGRHFEHPAVAWEKLMKEHDIIADRTYLREIALKHREVLDDLISDPPQTDSFGNTYKETREEAIRCFLNNFAVDRQLNLTLQQSISEINAALGWEGKTNNEQYLGRPISGNEVAGETGFFNWLRKLFGN